MINKCEVTLAGAMHARPKAVGTCVLLQKVHNPFIREHTLNHIRDPYTVFGIFPD